VILCVLLIMKPTLQIITISLFAILSLKLQAQQISPTLNVKSESGDIINLIAGDKNINADSTFRLLSNFSGYPEITLTGKDYLYYYTDSIYGKLPLRVFIPATYKPGQPNTCVLLLHGAVGGVKLSDIDTASKFDDLLFALLKKRDYIIIRPVADPSIKFDWVVNRFKGSANPTFKTLSDILLSLKKILNIDDNKVFAFGHSDGSDGAVGLAVFKPNQFAGVIAYNSMLTNIFAKDFYIRNIINTPLYDVHSDLDDLRPIQQNRVVINELTRLDPDIIYKEYIGYQHYDKHLDKDIPYTQQYINSVSRNQFKSAIYWETDSAKNYNACDWLTITGIDSKLPAAPWHKDLQVESYNKRIQKFMPGENYYAGLNASAAVKAKFHNNMFDIQTSGISGIELLISPVMVNLEQPVTVNINGKQAFIGKVIADKAFMINDFKSNFDRDAIWVTSLKLKVD
jgi:predicted esterase